MGYQEFLLLCLVSFLYSVWRKSSYAEHSAYLSIDCLIERTKPLGGFLSFSESFETLMVF